MLPSYRRFTPGAETIVVTDASTKGLGALLKQVIGGKELLIACASRSLRGAELNYSVIEKEALAIYWALGKYRNFLWGTQFKVCSDHKPLKDLFKKRFGLGILKDPSLGDWTTRIKFLRGTCAWHRECVCRLLIQAGGQ